MLKSVLNVSKPCHCEERSDVAIRIPCIRRMPGAYRSPEQTVKKVSISDKKVE